MDGYMKTSENAGLHFQIALSEPDRSEAIHFIETQMRRAYNCEPPETNGVICIARNNNEIVGSIALYGVEEGARFPLESYYDFILNNCPFPFERSNFVQVGRWIAIRPNVSHLLLLVSFQMAYDMGKRYALIEAKPYSAKRLLELGFNCKEISGATLVEENVRKIVGDDGMKYFTEPPKPSLYMIELKQS
jgi:hypothetical protein